MGRTWIAGHPDARRGGDAPGLARRHRFERAVGIAAGLDLDECRDVAAAHDQIYLAWAARSAAQEAGIL